jgi:hypothetical protein
MIYWEPSSVLLGYTRWVTGYPVLFFCNIPHESLGTQFCSSVIYYMSHWVPSSVLLGYTSSWHSEGIMFLRNTWNWLFSDTASYPKQTEPSITQLQEHQTCTVLMRYNIRRQQTRVSTSRRVRDSTVPSHKKHSYVYTNVMNTQKPHVLHQSKCLHAYMNNTQIYNVWKSAPCL